MRHLYIKRFIGLTLITLSAGILGSNALAQLPPPPEGDNPLNPELPDDYGVHIPKQTPVRGSNLTSSYPGGTSTTDLTADGNPLMTWDGRLRVQIEDVRYDVDANTVKCMKGLMPVIIDYQNFSVDTQGKITYSYKVDNTAYDPTNYRVALGKEYYIKWADENGVLSGPGTRALRKVDEWYIDKTFGASANKDCNSSGNQYMLDDATGTGDGNGFSNFTHVALAPNPDRTGANPYLSDATGQAVANGVTTNYMTYDILIIGTAYGAPKKWVKHHTNAWSYCTYSKTQTTYHCPTNETNGNGGDLFEDADFSSSHAYYPGKNGNNELHDRARLVTSVGKIVVQFSVQNGYRVLDRIVTANLDKNSMAPIRAQNGGYNGDSLIRGYEPGIDASGNLIVMHSDPAPSNNVVGRNQNVGFGEAWFIQRAQGKYSDPRNATTPLRFKTPIQVAKAYQSAGDLIATGLPGEGLTFGEYYSIMSLPIVDGYLKEGLDNASNIRYPGAYLWLGMGGNLLYHTSAGAWGAELEALNAKYPTCFQGGLQTTAGSGCINNNRGATGIVSPLVTANVGGTEMMPIMNPDGPSNASHKTLSRLMAHGFLNDGPWSPIHHLPPSARKNVMQMPGEDVFGLYSFSMDVTNGTFDYGNSTHHSANGRAIEEGHTGTIYGEMRFIPKNNDYLFFTSFNAGTSFKGNNSHWSSCSGSLCNKESQLTFEYLPNTAYTDVELQVQSGAYTPYTDPRDMTTNGPGTFYTKDFTGTLQINGNTTQEIDNTSQYDREESIGRLGQGMYCAAPGEITLSSGSGKLADYTNDLSAEIWVKPLTTGTPYTILKNPAIEIKFNASKQIVVKATSATDATVTTKTDNFGGINAGNWYHIAVNASMFNSTAIVDLYVNGAIAKSTSASNSQYQSLKTAGTTTICPGTTGNVEAPVMIVDEAGMRNRLMSGTEIADAALLPRPTIPDSTNRLGPMLARIEAAKLNPEDAYVPVDNPITQEKINLGRLLFFDKHLSSNGMISCSSCHKPTKGFGDSAATSTGVTNVPGPLHAPHIVNLIFSKPWTNFFWNGRANTLEEQVVGPLFNPDEHGLNSVQDAVDIVKLDQWGVYASAVPAAFSGTALTNFTQDQLGKALATYVRSLIVGDSPWDQFIAGKNTLDLNASKGAKIFMENCIACHTGPRLSNDDFHNVGAFDLYPGGTLTTEQAALGRFEVTGRSRDLGSFRTPGLRDLQMRQGTLFHDGSFDISEVVDSYQKGGEKRNVSANAQHVDFHIRPFSASEKTDLETFLLNAFDSGYDQIYTSETDPFIMGL